MMKAKVEIMQHDVDVVVEDGSPTCSAHNAEQLKEARATQRDRDIRAMGPKVRTNQFAGWVR